MFTYNVKYITPRDCFYKKQILVLLEPKLLADYETGLAMTQRLFYLTKGKQLSKIHVTT